jgi:hypothetical protein
VDTQTHSQPDIQDHEPDAENLPDVPEQDTNTNGIAAEASASSSTETGIGPDPDAHSPPAPPASVGLDFQEEGNAGAKPADDTPPASSAEIDIERAQAMRAKLDAHDAAVAQKVADKQIELDRIQPETTPQVVKIRAGLNSHRLGLVIRRANGDYVAEQLGHRHQPEITLEPGDQLMIAPLGGDTLRDFMRMADMAPASLQSGEDVAASPGGTA